MKSELSEKQCKACKPGTPALSKAEIGLLLPEIPGWDKEKGKAEISKTYEFKDFYKTMAFVNAVAWMANQQNHHPDMEVGYSKCKVKFSTHSVGGLSENDFICAAKVEGLFEV
jgi:4a-hydroxytetrahydrobiopterin dehydratase